MRSPTLLPTRMNVAEIRASNAIADCTPLTVVSRSRTTDEIETFMSDVSTTSTNIAIASRIGSRLDGACASAMRGRAPTRTHRLAILPGGRGTRQGAHTSMPSTSTGSRGPVDHHGRLGIVDVDDHRHL